MKITLDSRINNSEFYCLPYNLGVSGNTVPDLLLRLEQEINSRRDLSDSSLGFQGKQYAAVLAPSHIEASKDSLDGTSFYVFNAGNDSFNKKYKKHTSQEPGIFADSAYDSVIALVGAIKKSNSTKPSKI